MVALGLTFVSLLLAQSPPAAPATITFRPPVTGELQILRIRKEIEVGDRQLCVPLVSTRPGAPTYFVLRYAADLQSRIVTVRAGRIASSQVTYVRSDRSLRQCTGAARLHQTPLHGHTFIIQATPGQPLLIIPQGTRLTKPQKLLLLEEHLAFRDLRDLYLTQPRLVVTSGRRVPELERAILPILRRVNLYALNPTTLVVRYSRAELRKGRLIALFDVEAASSGLPARIVSLSYEGCLALEVQTGRLEFLDLKAAPGASSAVLPPRTIATKVTIEAEYP